VKKPVPNCSTPGIFDEKARLISDEDIELIEKLQAVYMDMSIAQFSLCRSSGLDRFASDKSMDKTLSTADHLEKTE
jgi:hypothetical protein